MLPPIHRADHQPIFISVLDPAWDHDRIGREEQILTGVTKSPKGAEPLPWSSIADYPMTRYWSGESRGDLATVAEYIRPDVAPTKFVLRRLDLTRWIENKQLRERGLMVAARFHAVRHGLIAIDDGPPGADLEFGPGGSGLTDASLQCVRALLGEEGFKMLGLFAINVSMEPSPLELPR